MIQFIFKIFFDDLPYIFLKTFAKYIPKAKARWLATFYPDSRIRKLFFQLTNVEVGENTFVNQNITIVDDFYSNKTLVKIGNRVALSPGIVFIAYSTPNMSSLNDHSYVKNHLLQREEIIVEDDAWIGAGAIILPGIVIGQGSIVGAGSVVTKNVAPHTIVAGIPAEKVRSLNSID